MEQNLIFFAREDGYDAICDDYGMNFKDTMDLDVSIKYDAVKQGQVDVIDVYTTDGRLENSNIVVLEDDKDFLSFLLDSDFSIDNFNLSVEKGDFCHDDWRFRMWKNHYFKND